MAKARLCHSDGDHLTFLKVFDAWEENSRSRDWCRDNYINAKTMTNAAVSISTLESLEPELEYCCPF